MEWDTADINEAEADRRKIQQGTRYLMRFNTPDTFWYLSSVARDISKCLGGLNRVKSKVLRLDISCILRSSEKNRQYDLLDLHNSYACIQNMPIFHDSRNDVLDTWAGWVGREKIMFFYSLLYSSTSSTNSIPLLEKKSLKCYDTVSLIKLGAILKYIVHMYIAIKNQKWYKKGAFQRVAHSRCKRRSGNNPCSRCIFSVLLRWANAIKVWANAIKMLV